MKFPYRPPFYERDVKAWIQLHQPTEIAMTDHQYAYLAGSLRHCPQKIEGIPIKFLDAPA